MMPVTMAVRMAVVVTVIVVGVIVRVVGHRGVYVSPPARQGNARACRYGGLPAVEAGP